MARQNLRPLHLRRQTHQDSLGVAASHQAEARAAVPLLAKLGVDEVASATNPGGSMEGKEVRFGVADSALRSTELRARPSDAKHTTPSPRPANRYSSPDTCGTVPKASQPMPTVHPVIASVVASVEPSSPDR